MALSLNRCAYSPNPIDASHSAIPVMAHLWVSDNSSTLGGRAKEHLRHFQKVPSAEIHRHAKGVTSVPPVSVCPTDYFDKALSRLKDITGGRGQVSSGSISEILPLQVPPRIF
jgi:hypothetical protein